MYDYLPCYLIGYYKNTFVCGWFLSTRIRITKLKTVKSEGVRGHSFMTSAKKSEI